MSRHEIGIDLIDIDRIVHVLGRFPDRFRLRVLTEREQRYCGRRVERIAGRWAAKEAISKVLGLGVRGRRLARDRDPAEPGRRAAGVPPRTRGPPSGGAGPRGGDRLASRTSATWRWRWRSRTAGTTERPMARRRPIDHPALGRRATCRRGPSARTRATSVGCSWWPARSSTPAPPCWPGSGAMRAGAGLVRVAAAESVARGCPRRIPELTWMRARRGGPGLIAPGGWRRAHDRGGGVRRGRDRSRARPPAGHAAARPAAHRGARGVPAVVDADALNALADGARWWQSAARAARPDAASRRVRAARRRRTRPTVDDDDARGRRRRRDAAARWGQVVVLKGAHTRRRRSRRRGPARPTSRRRPSRRRAAATCWRASSAPSWPAGAEPFVAAACGVAVHGAAGLLADGRIGQRRASWRATSRASCPRRSQQLRGGERG